MGKGKGQFRSNMLKINRGVNHLPLKKAPGGGVKQITEDTSHQIASAHTDLPQHDLDFYSKTFGHICVKELRANNSAKDIQLFFEELELVKDVIITVKDADYPRIDENSFLVLELGNHTRKIHARFFRAILPEKLKEPYVRRHKDHFERMTGLLQDAHKGIFAEDY